jgi:hypothetical protein
MWGFAPYPTPFFGLIQKREEKNQGKTMLLPALLFVQEFKPKLGKPLRQILERTAFPLTPARRFAIPALLILAISFKWVR